MNVIKGMKFGFSTYVKHGAFGALNLIKKSKFGANGDDSDGDAAVLGFAGSVMMTILILVIVSLVLGVVAVSKICPGSDTRSNNVRIGLYALLFFTGGSVAWIYILLWILGVKF